MIKLFNVIKFNSLSPEDKMNFYQCFRLITIKRANPMDLYLFKNYIISLSIKYKRDKRLTEKGLLDTGLGCLYTYYDVKDTLINFFSNVEEENIREQFKNKSDAQLHTLIKKYLPKNNRSALYITKFDYYKTNETGESMYHFIIRNATYNFKKQMYKNLIKSMES